jgi:hypothetical protein
MLRLMTGWKAKTLFALTMPFITQLIKHDTWLIISFTSKFYPLQDKDWNKGFRYTKLSHVISQTK